MRILHCRMRILHCRMRIRRELEYKYEICCNAAGDEYELETCLGAGAVGVSLALGRALGIETADECPSFGCKSD